MFSHPRQEGQLLSGGEDNKVCLWQAEAGGEQATVFEGHSAGVNEVDWHRHHECLFGSVGGILFSLSLSLSSLLLTSPQRTTS